MTLSPTAFLTRGPRRLATARWPVRFLVFAAIGAAMGLGQVPVSLPVATLAALAAVFLILAPARPGAFAGWALGVGYFALTLHWIVDPFLVEPERTGWLAPFALVLTATGFALFWAAPFGLARALRLGPIGLAALWAAAEMARSFLFTGFPWALIGHVWIGTPLEQLAAVMGVHGLTLMTLLAAAVLVHPRAGRLRAVPLVLLAGGIFALDPGPAPAPDPAAPLIRVVQPNIPQEEKWDPERIPGALRRLVDLSAAVPGEARRADLVVWPETALPWLLADSLPVIEEAARAAGGAPVASGVIDQDARGAYTNSLVVADAQGRVTARYDKVHLVPFGEYMPFAPLFSRVGLDLVAQFQGPGFATGPGPALVELPGIGLARPLICYEGIFPEEIATPERPRLLLLVTNDAWFGDRAGPRQHFELGRLRAIETGLPLVRSANTGISAVIDGKGRILASLPLHQAGAIEAPLPPVLAPTIYARWGDAPVALLLLLVAAGALVLRGIDRGRGSP